MNLAKKPPSAAASPSSAVSDGGGAVGAGAFSESTGRAARLAPSRALRSSGSVVVMSVAASTTAGASSVDAWTTTSTWKQLGSLEPGLQTGSYRSSTSHPSAR